MFSSARVLCEVMSCPKAPSNGIAASAKKRGRPSKVDALRRQAQMELLGVDAADFDARPAAKAQAVMPQRVAQAASATSMPLVPPNVEAACSASARIQASHPL